MKKTIGDSEFEFLLKIEKQRFFKDYVFKFSNNYTLDLSEIKNLSFKNCFFNGEYVDFIGENIERISFRNCILDIDTLIFDEIQSKRIYFDKVTIKGYFSINDVKTSFLRISNKCNFNKLSIHNLSVKVEFLIKESSINDFGIFGSTIEISLKIQQSKLGFLKISYSKFVSSVFINDNVFTKIVSVNNNNFNHFSLVYNSFIPEKKIYKIIFNDNNFQEKADFSNLKGEEIPLSMSSCTFQKFVEFDNSQLKSLYLENVNFLDISSFQNINLNNIYIINTSFDKTAFFDEINVKCINQCDKRTIRAIKQQLFLSENRIDYNKFRAYELNAYNIELKQGKKKWHNDSDAFILDIQKWSDYGTNWSKALMYTLIFGFVFYVLLFIIHNYKFSVELSFEALNRFVTGYFRYLLITDFYNPMAVTKEYLSNSIEWFFFIIGKIFIGIGIYETISSFRKYKK